MNMIDRFLGGLAGRGLLASLGLAAMALCLTGAPLAHAQSREADSDDFNCNHGAPDDPATVEACRRLRGYAASGGGFVTIHLVRDFGTHYVGGRAYRSARDAIEFNCAAGERRRVGYVLYSGHGATGVRVAAGRTPSPWRRVPKGAMPYACR